MANLFDDPRNRENVYLGMNLYKPNIDKDLKAYYEQVKPSLDHPLLIYKLQTSLNCNVLLQIQVFQNQMPRVQAVSLAK